MMQRLIVIIETIRGNGIRLFLVAGLFACAYYLLLLLGLILRFGELPNYINVYPWLDNITTIIASTPSLKDTLLIIKDEWLLEIGYMNYDYGAGISEWSLFFAPVKVLGVIALGTLLIIIYWLMRQQKKQCTPMIRRSTGATAGLGATFVALASVTMSWVVCCSYPTWVVGLAMMGLGVSTSLWLEPMGLTVSSIGFGLLILALFFAADPRQHIKGTT